MPLTTLFQWIFDVTLFKIHYTVGQDISLAFLGALYVFQGLKYMLWDAKKAAKKELEK